MIDREIAKELWTIITAIGSGNEEEDLALMKAVVRHMRAYFIGDNSRRKLLWHLKRFRNEAISFDVRRSGG